MFFKSGIETENYTEYLENFCNEFIEDTKTAIVEKLASVMAKKSSVDSEKSSNYEEIFHHLRFAEHKSSMFFGREDLIGFNLYHLTLKFSKLYKKFQKVFKSILFER